MSDEKDPALAEYHALGPTRFHDLIRFALTVDESNDSREMGLEIDLASEEVDSHNFLRLTLSRISQLKYVPDFWSFDFIDVVAVERGWESIRYRAFETEQDTDFSVNCYSFKAQILSFDP